MMEISAIFFFVIDTAISFFIKQIPSAYLFLCQTFKKLLVMQHILIECPLYQLLLLYCVRTLQVCQTTHYGVIRKS